MRPQAHEDRTNAERPASIGIVATVISAAKVASNFSNWQDLVNNDLLHEHGREELQADLFSNPTQSVDKLKRLFEEGTRLYILWPRVSADLARHCEMVVFPPHPPAYSNIDMALCEARALRSHRRCRRRGRAA